MLAKRIIPCLDVTGGRVVKGVNFLNLRDAGDPVEIAKAYDEQRADELCFLDITASSSGRETMIDIVNRTADQVFMPVTVGGGVRTVEDVRALLKAGADKVSINTAAVRNPLLVHEAHLRFGSSTIVVAVDARKHGGSTPVSDDVKPLQFEDWEGWDSVRLDPDADPEAEGDQWEVFVFGGRTPTGIDAVKWCRALAELGAGEILLTSMDADGSKAGYDIGLTRAVSDVVPVPVIASGGAGNLEHLREALDEGRADAALAASIFHFREYTIDEARDYLRDHGVPVRD